MGLGYVEGVTHDYVRHGTTTNKYVEQAKKTTGLNAR